MMYCPNCGQELKKGKETTEGYGTYAYIEVEYQCPSCYDKWRTEYNTLEQAPIIRYLGEGE